MLPRLCCCRRDINRFNERFLRSGLQFRESVTEGEVCIRDEVGAFVVDVTDWEKDQARDFDEEVHGRAGVHTGQHCSNVYCHYSQYPRKDRSQSSHEKSNLLNDNVKTITLSFNYPNYQYGIVVNGLIGCVLEGSKVVRMDFDNFGKQQPCPHCDGSGTIVIPIEIPCPTCSPTDRPGLNPIDPNQLCPTCHGRGTYSLSEPKTPYPPYSTPPTVQPCSTCGITDYPGLDPTDHNKICPTCHGTGNNKLSSPNLTSLTGAFCPTCGTTDYPGLDPTDLNQLCPTCHGTWSATSLGQNVYQTTPISNRSYNSQFYSVFISYSSKDEDFARYLVSQLLIYGLDCWFAPKDMRIGYEIRTRIHENILLYDKLLVILSDNSIKSTWVYNEIEVILEKEHKQKLKELLIPIKVDNKVKRSKIAWVSHIRRTRHIGDFTNWNDRTSFMDSLHDLLECLKK